MSPDALPLGPLPRADTNDELQQQSLAAFRRALPSYLFLVRDERTDDKGVDLALEVKAGDRFTNFRAQVQLKATGEPATNSDGSFSLPVPTSNLNYLLNGSSPLYAVWIAPRDELRLIWARDEAKRLQAANPQWQDQSTITLRFPRPVRPDDWDVAHARILREGRFYRQSHDALTRTVVAGTVALGVDTATLRVTSSEEAAEVLAEHGPGMVSAGHARAVLDLTRLLAHHARSLPQTQFVAGYAHYALGDYFSARSELGRAVLGRELFTPVDRHILDALLDASDYRLGRIDETEFWEARRRQEASAPPGVAAQLRLDRLRTEHLQAHDESRRAALHAELRRVADALQTMDVGETLKLEARIVRLYADGAENNLALLDATCRAQMGSGMGRFPLTAAVQSDFAAVDAESLRLDAEGRRLLEQAQALGHPLLVADAIYAHTATFLGRLVDLRTQAGVLGRSPLRFPDALVGEFDRRLGHAIRCYEGAGNTEGVVRATILLVHWMEVTDRDGVARGRLNGILGLARAMGYDHSIRQIEEALAGDSEYHRYTTRLANPPDLDAEMAAMSDDDVRRYARHCLEAAELPAERLPVVEREAFSGRGICREKMTWCRHIELIQDTRHQLSPATHYQTDPPRVGFCTRHRHQSRVESPDWAVVIDAFKACYCAGCPDRSPKQAVAGG